MQCSMCMLVLYNGHLKVAMLLMWSVQIYAIGDARAPQHVTVPTVQSHKHPTITTQKTTHAPTDCCNATECCGKTARHVPSD